MSGRTPGLAKVTGNIVAVIPARGGSKRVPRKNLLPLAGQPLVAHSIRHALGAKCVSAVVVSTDDEEIARIASALGAEVVVRPADLAADTSSSESAVLHALDERLARGEPEPQLVVLLQCTSPVRTAADIDAAVDLLVNSEADSVLSACRDHSFYWQASDASARPLNYDPAERPREQDMALQFRENGSIYVTRTDALRATGNRLPGRRVLYEMDYWSSFQLDAEEDVELLEWILGRNGHDAAVAWPERIDLVVFDFDGVMTDNAVLVTSSGDEAVRCNRSDGWGVARLRDAGMSMLVLSTEAHPVVSARARKLGIGCIQGVVDKCRALAAELDSRGLDGRSVVYVGNDVNDLGCFDLVAMPVAVADAHPTVAARARLVLNAPGGDGAVREICDLILERLRAGASAGGR